MFLLLLLLLLLLSISPNIKCSKTLSINFTHIVCVCEFQNFYNSIILWRSLSDENGEIVIFVDVHDDDEKRRMFGRDESTLYAIYWYGQGEEFYEKIYDISSSLLFFNKLFLYVDKSFFFYFNENMTRGH